MTRESTYSAVPTASHLDQLTGVREEAGFYGPGDLKMLGCTYVPPGASKGAVVICSPLLAESVRNYRREVLLARALASNGFAVQRFQSRGFGNSDGDGSEATFETMLVDAIAAGERVMARTGTDEVAFMGTRWGGLIAGAAAARFGPAPLVLWEPVIDGERYFRDVFRSRFIHNLKDGGSSTPSREALVRELRESGSIDILGWSLHWAFYESSVGRILDQELGDHPHPTLLLQIGQRRDLRDELASLVRRLSGRGFEVEAHTVEEQPDWWFVGDRWIPDEGRGSSEELTRVTVDWISRTMAC
jgi:pimeloyl-ACP methyl ester carboxylesterase